MGSEGGAGPGREACIPAFVDPLVRLGRWLGWLTLVASFLPGGAGAQALPRGVDEVKAAYLYKFLGYVEWPEAAFAAAVSPLVIGVVGADGVHAELVRVLGGRTAHGRPLVARRVSPGEPLDNVQALFVGDAALVSSPWLQQHRDRPLLIVTDTPRGLDAGASLNFVLAQDRLRFEASPRAADRAGLRVSSRLLVLAQRVLVAP